MRRRCRGEERVLRKPGRDVAPEEQGIIAITSFPGHLWRQRAPLRQMRSVIITTIGIIDSSGERSRRVRELRVNDELRGALPPERLLRLLLLLLLLLVVIMGMGEWVVVLQDLSGGRALIVRLFE